MLQTFINLLKDYTKEVIINLKVISFNTLERLLKDVKIDASCLQVDSSFKNFKTDMETSLKAIKQNMEDGSQRIDDKVMSS